MDLFICTTQMDMGYFTFGGHSDLET